MSAYITLNSPMTEQDLLVQALQRAGVPSAHIEVNDRPVPLHGYSSRDRLAEVIIRREHLAVQYSDLGFERTPTGFRLHVDDLDRDHANPQWMAGISREYQVLERVRQQRIEQERERRRREIEAEVQRAQKAQDRELELRARRERERLEAEQLRAEQELRRKKAERRALVEAQTEAVRTRAAALGYEVTEKREEDRLRLVLVKRTY